MTDTITPPSFSRRQAMIAAGAVLLSPALPARVRSTPDRFSERDDVRAFCADLAAAHGFDEGALLAQFAEVRLQPKVIQLIRPPSSPAVKSWARYRSRFVEPVRIRAGLDFLSTWASAFERAEAQYGVPREIVAAIIGVETLYGRHTGDFELLDALSTLAFTWPPRAELFRRELGELFMLARDLGRSAGDFRGSYAGALGYPQFLPSSWRRFAVDFDGDGRSNLIASPVDAIGSVAAYLNAHGWEAGQPVAQRILIDDSAAAPLVAAGVEPSIDAATAAAAGARPLREEALIAKPATLVDLVTPDAPTEYWLGFRNFYAITRYNRTYFYAMSVFQLGEALRAG
jgi:membrane-bound lytic murein transglycosylase B